MGLHTNWSGDVQFGGDRLHPHPQRRTKETRRTVQYVFQNPFGSLDPRTTLADNLEQPVLQFVNACRRERVDEVHQILRRWLSSEYAGRMPRQSSGGDRQRVAVGRIDRRSPDVGLRRNRLRSGRFGPGAVGRATPSASDRARRVDALHHSQHGRRSKHCSRRGHPLRRSDRRSGFHRLGTRSPRARVHPSSTGLSPVHGRPNPRRSLWRGGDGGPVRVPASSCRASGFARPILPRAGPRDGRR